MTHLNAKELTVGYCTNVHAGTYLGTIRDNLDQYATPVRNSLIKSTDVGFQAEDSLPVGLWIPNEASQALSVGMATEDFGRFLADRKLLPYTINGFPFDNFHQDVVKHRVYLPSWCDRERLEYTKRLANILSKLIPDRDDGQATGSISTLPIGWPNNPCAGESDRQDVDVAGANLREMARHLATIESETGRRIVVAIEPEPGCILDDTDDMLRFFDAQITDAGQRRYITVCHDVCHSSVMMENQADVLRRFGENGIQIGKVQVSSAIRADWESMADGRRIEAMSQLSEFAEDRYLHQTGILDPDGNFKLAEDLPKIVQTNDQPTNDQRWVVHFHVPIFLERFEHLSTTREDIVECLRTLIGDDALSGVDSPIDFTGHLEIETYAWTVLPEASRKRGLADDIAGEFLWLHRAIEMCG